MKDIKIDYRAWARDIPFLDFGDGYMYKPTPPFSNAV